MKEKIGRIKDLVVQLNQAAKTYYQEDKEIMSNVQYDKLYDELKTLEEETGFCMSNSPSVRVGYEILSALPKEAHEVPMLSLDKTKNTGDLKEWLKDKTGILSWKLDGLTVVLTYEDGKLVKAVTRGNGQIGEVITSNAKVFKNIPLTISHKGKLVIRGEAVIRYSDFSDINAGLDAEEQYKNPRNLCSGTVRQLNSQVAAARPVYFFAFGLVNETEVPVGEFRQEQFHWLTSLGFDCVEFETVDLHCLEETVQSFYSRIESNDFPSDGLVLAFDDITYGRALGVTSKFPRDSIAFKWADEIRETTLREIEWSASRTGLINPVAIFDPVELEGTTVSRASVHNVSILKELELGIGDMITVYKANMIIPQIEDNLSRSNSVEIPKYCPVCGENTQVRSVNDVDALYCVNPKCAAKKIKGFAHYVSRDAMNIEGFSEATIEKCIEAGLLQTLPEIYTLKDHEDELVAMDGFGKKAFAKLTAAIERSKQVQLPHLIYSLGIPGVGLSNARMIVKAFDNDVDKVMNADVEQLQMIDGIGHVLAEAFTGYFANPENKNMVNELLNVLELERVQVDQEQQTLEGVVVVITGSLNQFSDRSAMKKAIEEKGGKVTSAVSSKTQFLINNNVDSNSSKNKKAKELGVEIISEGDFIQKFLS